jgi:hypothetical protein
MDESKECRRATRTIGYEGLIQREIRAMLRLDVKVNCHEVPNYGLAGGVVTKPRTATSDDTCHAHNGSKK